MFFVDQEAPPYYIVVLCGYYVEKTSFHNIFTYEIKNIITEPKVLKMHIYR